ncbi:MAG: hypothetical protein KC635_22500 [Myxococcales bacterium]|nr:hypothetical protein [Myxococcales bacterium]
MLPTSALRIAALASAMFVAGCATTLADRPHADRRGAFAGETFAHVPADTAYVIATDGESLESMRAQSERVSVPLHEAATALGELIALYDGLPDPGDARAIAAFYAQVMETWSVVLDPDRLAAAGVRFPLRTVLYADPALPVVRVALADAAAMKRALGDLFATGGVLTASGPGSWRADLGGIGVAVTVTPEELVIVAAFTSELDSALARALAPARGESANAALEALATTERARSVGWLDLGALGWALMRAIGQNDRDACDREQARLFGGLPRLTLASEQSAHGGRFVARLRLADPELAAALATLAARGRALAATPLETGFSLGATIDLDGMLGIVRLLRDRGRAAGYTCPDVVALVDDLDSAAKALTVAKLRMRGLRAAFVRGSQFPTFDGSGRLPEGLVALAFDGPDGVERLLGDAAARLPATGEVDTRSTPMGEITVARRDDLLVYGSGDAAVEDIARVMAAGTVASGALIAYVDRGGDSNTVYATFARQALTDLLGSMGLPPNARVEGPAVVVDGVRVDADAIYELLDVTADDVVDQAVTRIDQATRDLAVARWLDSEGAPALDGPPILRLRAYLLSLADEAGLVPAPRPKDGRDPGIELAPMPVDARTLALYAWRLAEDAEVDRSGADALIAKLASFHGRVAGHVARITAAAERFGGLSDEEAALAVEGGDLVLRSTRTYRHR